MYVEEQSHGGADDRALKQLDAARKAEDVARARWTNQRGAGRTLAMSNGRNSGPG